MDKHKRLKVHREEQVQRQGLHARARRPAADTADSLRPAGALTGSVGKRSTDEQAAWLSGRRLQRAQRYALATQIGRLQGNQHLGKVVDQSNRDLANGPPWVRIQQCRDGEVAGAECAIRTSMSSGQHKNCI